MKYLKPAGGFLLMWIMIELTLSVDGKAKAFSWAINDNAGKNIERHDKIVPLLLELNEEKESRNEEDNAEQIGADKGGFSDHAENPTNWDMHNNGISNHPENLNPNPWGQQGNSISDHPGIGFGGDNDYYSYDYTEDSNDGSWECLKFHPVKIIASDFLAWNISKDDFADCVEAMVRLIYFHSFIKSYWRRIK